MTTLADAPQPGLTDSLKDEIQQAYRRWLGGRGFKPRVGQRQMIATIARTLAAGDGRRCVVEAGTGTGKTLAYCLATIPIAKAQDKRVVIATATVALQEQVVLRDLPDLQRHGQLDFTFTLAKGRGRYICLKRLDDRIGFDQHREAPLFEPPQVADLTVYRQLQSAYGNGSWDGDLDSWEDGVDRRVWAPVTNDRAGCGAGRCGYYHQCAFFRARREATDADVVVANHDLVLADLSLGGGVVLPDPEETIFVFDEAHHLPDKTREHFTASVRLRGTAEWVAQAASSVDTMARRFNRPREVERAAQRLAAEASDIARLLGELQTLARDLPFQRHDDSTAIHRFAQGDIPPPLAELALPLGKSFAVVAATLEELRAALEDVMDGSLSWDNADQAEAWLPALGQLVGRAAAGQTLFDDYGAASGRQAARWATRHAFDAGHEIELASAPLDPGGILHEMLWERCGGAVATSATLCALGTFDHFLGNAGLASDTTQARIASPFDFPRIATFSVPAMRSNPGDAAAHTQEIAARLPELLAQERSALVLFTSWRQFNAVTEALPPELLSHCRLQDTASKQRLLSDHRNAVDAGEPSYLFGLASFSEGVDLPGDYCRHVIIAKIPFAVPDNPVDEAVAEWLTSQGRNPFMEMSVPEASLRLVQACGRLIRHETDSGRITLLDRRIATRRYGRSLLASLPPFRLDVAVGQP